MQVVPELVERNFGELELQQDSNYQKVWDADLASLSSAPAGGVESVTQASCRDCKLEHLMFQAVHLQQSLPLAAQLTSAMVDRRAASALASVRLLTLAEHARQCGLPQDHSKKTW